MSPGRFTGFPAKLLQNFDRPGFLVVDGSSVHKAKKAREYVAGTGGEAGTVRPPAVLVRAEPR
jgi:hypothetical protein